jgi:hypothetical protein
MLQSTSDACSSMSEHLIFYDEIPNAGIGVSLQNLFNVRSIRILISNGVRGCGRRGRLPVTQNISWIRPPGIPLFYYIWFMKRFLSLAILGLIFSVGYALGTDSGIVVVKDTSCLSAYSVHLYSADVDQPAWNDADLLSPKFVSNFNRLVEFPETGTPALCSGFSTVARGPPKSQNVL